MAKRRGMTEGELAALVRSKIDASISYDDSTLSTKRAKALEYYNGTLTDVPAEPNRSSVTSHDLSDAIGWILPGLMRTFTASSKIVEYQPQRPEDDASAKQATDYVNYLFARECDGYRIMQHGCQEGLTFGNGIVKHWWETKKEYETLSYSGLSDDAFTMLVDDDEVEVVEHTETIEMAEEIDPTTGAPVEVPVRSHACKIKRLKSTGCLRIECLPPEEFLIDKQAKSIPDAGFTAHRYKASRSDLIAEGYDEDKVMDLGSERTLDSAPERVARDGELDTEDDDDTDDEMTEEVEVFECYVRCDYDGDRHAEMRRVVMAGSGADRSILANDEWEDDSPFSDFVPLPVPHRWAGRSLYDELEDVQRVKTVLMRQTLDNLYWVNHPMLVALKSSVENMDALLNPKFGEVIEESTTGAVRPLAVPFVADNSFTMMEFLDQLAERRTGVSRTSQALDPDALQNQTAAGVMAAQSAAYAKMELYARNIAELGLKRMFSCILKLIVRYQDRPRMIRLRDQWVEMDPRSWNADMDAKIAVGLGTGTRDRDMAMLQQVAAMQKEMIAEMGPTNPVSNIKQLSHTMARLVEVSGLNAPEAYVSEVSDEDMQAIAEAEAGKTDPETEKARAQIEVEAAKAQSQAEIARAKAASDADLARAKAAADMQAQRERNAMEIQALREKAQAEMAIEREKATLNAQLKREEMQLEAALTAEANRMNAAVAAKQADTNIQDRSQ